MEKLIFEVSANKNKPFYVHTSKGEIKVLGTHFNLELILTLMYLRLLCLKAKFVSE